MNKSALITGAAGAVGFAVATDLANQGWSLVLSGHAADPVEPLAERLTRQHSELQFTVMKADLSSPTKISKLVDEAAEWSNGLDGLVNNAGRPSRTPLTAIGVDEWDSTIAVNLRAPVLLMQSFASAHGTQYRSASIVNVASRTYETGGPVGYVASKAGLVGATRAAAFELGSFGIRVNAVAPSMMPTPFVGSSRSTEELDAFITRQSNLSALKRSLTPQELATSVSYLMSEDSSFVTGEVLHVAGGLQLPPVP